MESNQSVLWTEQRIFYFLISCKETDKMFLSFQEPVPPTLNHSLHATEVGGLIALLQYECKSV